MIRQLKYQIGKSTAQLIRFLARKAHLDLIRLGYVENGITKSYNYKASGEAYFISDYLPSQLEKRKAVFLDIGANKGDYTLMLRNSFPEATIFSFEPNPNTFEQLEQSVGEKARLFQLGVGQKKGTLELFFDAEDQTSVQATSNPEILRTIAGTVQIDKIPVEIITIDEFCKSHRPTENRY